MPTPGRKKGERKGIRSIILHSRRRNWTHPLSSLADNILFDRRATVEYTGRCGVVDLIRELDLTPQAALEISEHLPVWAEFSSYENGQRGHVP
jgi:hypothetical protein